MLEGFDFFKDTGVGKDIAGATKSVGDSIGNEVEKVQQKAIKDGLKIAEDAGKNELKKNTGLDYDTLNGLAGKANTAQSDCTGEGVNERKAKKLKGDMMKAQAELNKLTEDAALAEKNYYMFSEGGYLYDQRKMASEQKNADKEKQKLLDEHNKILRRFFSFLDVNNVNHGSNMQDLYNFYKRKNTNLKKGIDDYYKITETNNRNTIYDKENIDLHAVLKTVLLIIYVCVVIYYVLIVFVLNKNFNNYKAWVFLLIFILIPSVILPFIMDLIHTHIFGVLSKSESIHSSFHLINILTKLETLLLI
jgi:hypothetical protein